MSKYTLVVDYLKAFEQTLDDNHEVWLKMPGYNGSFLLLETMTCKDEFIAFELMSDTAEIFSVIQSYSQLNFSVFSKLKRNPSEPKKRIGFKN